MNAAFAVSHFNAPGIGGPEDAPEYDGPSVDDLVIAETRRHRVARHVWKNDFVTKDILALIFVAPEDFLAAVHRIRYEARKCAEADAREEFDDALKAFEKEIS
jgi:hypothetical protein